MCIVLRPIFFKSNTGLIIDVVLFFTISKVKTKVQNVFPLSTNQLVVCGENEIKMRVRFKTLLFVLKVQERHIFGLVFPYRPEKDVNMSL